MVTLRYVSFKDVHRQKAKGVRSTIVIQIMALVSFSVPDFLHESE